MRKNRTCHPRGELVDGFHPRRHPLYGTWANMMQRCYDSGHPTWVNYGGRGVTVQDSWHHFKNFAKDVGLPPKAGHTIDRKNNEGDYVAANITWSDRHAQNMNRRLFKNSSTGVRGVTQDANGFCVRVTVAKGVRKFLGRFSELATAIKVREEFLSGGDYA